ncbi:hypothetical protein TPAR_08724 [Tolypocladium paradoxum]|uniref:Uncharacterized protein n=1 Tax=Tolypocladium paradoxum TaxID=94208 RepID=A0A2S4KLL7_9HYPO|nr:hypothetical protein TPAR_08724 [Tolypocladium paradoxum]
MLFLPLYSVAASPESYEAMGLSMLDNPGSPPDTAATGSRTPTMADVTGEASSGSHSQGPYFKTSDIPEDFDIDNYGSSAIEDRVIDPDDRLNRDMSVKAYVRPGYYMPEYPRPAPQTIASDGDQSNEKPRMDIYVTDYLEKWDKGNNEAEASKIENDGQDRGNCLSQVISGPARYASKQTFDVEAYVGSSPDPQGSNAGGGDAGLASQTPGPSAISGMQPSGVGTDARNRGSSNPITEAADGPNVWEGPRIDASELLNADIPYDLFGPVVPARDNSNRGNGGA